MKNATTRNRLSFISNTSKDPPRVSFIYQASRRLTSHNLRPSSINQNTHHHRMNPPFLRNTTLPYFAVPPLPKILLHSIIHSIFLRRNLSLCHQPPNKVNYSLEHSCFSQKFPISASRDRRSSSARKKSSFLVECSLSLSLHGKVNRRFLFSSDLVRLRTQEHRHCDVYVYFGSNDLASLFPATCARRRG